ncbi:MAG: hypothetical protein QI197_04785 [Candidatus Korarchaeota archaeon]|nr:hypothetical protein [Candidatus Korarchaeota archaeon]
MEEFRKSPGESLQEALLPFIGELREEGERRGLRVFIVSNQAYRCGPRVMASADWNVSESHFTDVRNGDDGLLPIGGWEMGEPSHLRPRARGVRVRGGRKD